MEIRIVTRNVPLRRQLKSFIHKHVAAGLARFAAGVSATHVELTDRNGPRGGGDKRCRIRVSLAQGAAVTVEDVQANVKRAILRAMGRAQAQVHSQLRST